MDLGSTRKGWGERVEERHFGWEDYHNYGRRINAVHDFVAAHCIDLAALDKAVSAEARRCSLNCPVRWGYHADVDGVAGVAGAAGVGGGLDATDATDSMDLSLRESSSKGCRTMEGPRRVAGGCG